MAAVWVLNLDADLELGARGPYTPTRSVTRAMRAQRDRLAAALLEVGEDIVDETTPANAARGRPGLAFCPTPRALALLARAGAVPEPHPSVEVLRTVNGRAFSASLGAGLPGSAFVTDRATAEAKLRAGTGPWRAKRAFGMAGRGHRVIEPGALTAGDLDFVRGGLARGGLQIEPHVRIHEEFAIHGMIAPTGHVDLGRVVRQRCDPRGAWLATEPLDEPFVFARELEAEARSVACKLHEAGYFGPFGVDAFTHDGGFHARSEINARFSMGFPVGMPAWRTSLRGAS
jgi:hypothetical protein